MTDQANKSCNTERVTGSVNSTVPGMDNVDEEDQAAYRANYSTHKVGITVQETINNYNVWAQRGTYEADLAPGRYNGPEIATQAAAKYFDKITRHSVKLLDVAAGTGFVGEMLQQRGFLQVDALEPARNMLEQAKNKGLYANHICDVISDKPTDVPNDTYDAVIIAGGMGEGHIPCSGLLELIRIVKPGGVTIIVMREEYLSYVQEYVDRLEPMMQRLEGRGDWRREERTVTPRYSFGKNGVVFVHRVLTSGAPSGIDL